ncbi:uncharacterized protein LOC124437004 [Xenia sp. Carnegie-2017]|uniref:uncharacterized protein LOC124437004 n=1 Tax=Xenia sp. Carnegie-2017 TaxID=2897299 RepID=UPI001F03572F|nr:uncharacterized protein LOC124437004 [Xenia sp. Carnegie-2017]XP_046842967.1 uncharacterized protein LOC124437004 [Xenia sp. Carnegie-2017]
MAMAQESENTQMDIEDKVDEYTKQLTAIPVHMKTFAELLSILYDDKKFDSSVAKKINVDFLKDFEKIRDEIRDDAFIYIKVHLPQVEKILACIQCFFQNYRVLSYNDWVESLDDSDKEVRENKTLATLVMEFHQQKSTKLKADQNKRLNETSANLQLNYELQEKIDTFNEKAKHYKREPKISFFPLKQICMWIDNFLKNRWLKKAANAEKELNEWKDKILDVTNNMSKALEKYMTAVEQVASLFKLLQKDLEDSIKARKDKTRMSNMKRHYYVMQRKSGNIDHQIEKFFASLPGIHTAIEAIPVNTLERAKQMELNSMAVDIIDTISLQQSFTPALVSPDAVENNDDSMSLLLYQL